MKYIEGTDMEQFEHVPQISMYNRNYYIGFGRDLLYAHSEDDGCTEWYLISHYGVQHIGYSLCSEDEMLHHGKP
jgi:hypothetical protein